MEKMNYLILKVSEANDLILNPDKPSLLITHYSALLWLFTIPYLLFTLLFTGVCFAETLKIKDFRSDFSGAQMSATCGTFLGAKNSPQAGLVNPALLTEIGFKSLEVSYSNFYNWGIILNEISYGFKTEDTQAVSVTWADVSSFKMPIYDVERFPVNGEPTGSGLIVDENGNPVSFGTFRSFHNGLIFTYAFEFFRIPSGFNIRYLKRGFKGNSSDSYWDSVVNFSASAWTFDFGMIFNVKNFTIPVSFFNVASSKFQWQTEYEYNEELLKEIRAGLYWNLKNFSLGADFVKIEEQKLQIIPAFEVKKGVLEIQGSCEGEVYSLGFGFDVPIYTFLFKGNYAYKKHNVFGGTHYFGTQIKW